MADKNIIIHPIVNGEEDRSISLFPKTKKKNILDFNVTVGDINSASSNPGEVLTSDGNGGAKWEVIEIPEYTFATNEDVDSLFDEPVPPTPALAPFAIGQTIGGYDFGNAQNGEVNDDLDKLLAKLPYEFVEETYMCNLLYANYGGGLAIITAVKADIDGTTIYAILVSMNDESIPIYSTAEVQGYLAKGYQNLTNGKAMIGGDAQQYEISEINSTTYPNEWNGVLIGAVEEQPQPTGLTPFDTTHLVTAVKFDARTDEGKATYTPMDEFLAGLTYDGKNQSYIVTHNNSDDTLVGAAHIDSTYILVVGVGSDPVFVYSTEDNEDLGLIAGWTNLDENNEVSLGRWPEIPTYILPGDWNGTLIGAVLSDRYSVTTEVTNGTYSGSSFIDADGTATVTIIPDKDYELPDEVTVNDITGTQGSSGCNWIYDKNNSIITMQSPTGNITISVTCSENTNPLTPFDFKDLDGKTITGIKINTDVSTITFNGQQYSLADYMNQIPYESLMGINDAEIFITYEGTLDIIYQKNTVAKYLPNSAKWVDGDGKELSGIYEYTLPSSIIFDAKNSSMTNYFAPLNGVVFGAVEAAPVETLIPFEAGQTVIGFDFGDVEIGSTSQEMDDFLAGLPYDPSGARPVTLVGFNNQAELVAFHIEDVYVIMAYTNGGGGAPTFVYSTGDYPAYGIQSGYRNLVDGQFSIVNSDIVSTVHPAEGWNGILVGAIATEPVIVSYTITTDVKNGSYEGAGVIVEGGGESIFISADQLYNLPNNISVNGVFGTSGSNGVTWTYDPSKGQINLSNPSGDITISVECYHLSVFAEDTVVTNDRAVFNTSKTNGQMEAFAESLPYNGGVCWLVRGTTMDGNKTTSDLIYMYHDGPTYALFCGTTPVWASDDGSWGAISYTTGWQNLYSSRYPFNVGESIVKVSVNTATTANDWNGVIVGIDTSTLIDPIMYDTMSVYQFRTGASISAVKGILSTWTGANWLSGGADYHYVNFMSNIVGSEANNGEFIVVRTLTSGVNYEYAIVSKQTLNNQDYYFPVWASADINVGNGSIVATRGWQGLSATGTLTTPGCSYGIFTNQDTVPNWNGVLLGRVPTGWN